MAGAREILSKVGSIQKTSKITRAMQMVATSKMRKAQEQMKRTKPYAEKIRSVIGHMASGNPEYRSAFMETRPVKRAGYIVISSDRGLCGGLNNNLFRRTVAHMSELKAQDVELSFCLVGAKAESFFARHGGKILGSATHLGDKPKMTEVIGIVKVMLDAYAKGKIDVLYVAYNTFVNTMRQEGGIHQLLPFQPEESEATEGHWDYIYEPDAKPVLEGLIKRYMEFQVYQGVVENLASEQAARMVAMQSATDNAGKLIDELKLAYNKARQASITKELAEIVSGSAAV